MMRDTIFFAGMHLTARVGCLDHERLTSQPIVIDLEFQVNSLHAAKTDSINETINYDEVKNVIQQVIARGHYDLLETLANTVVDELMQKFPIPWLKFSVSKPSIYAEVKAVGVRLERQS